MKSKGKNANLLQKDDISDFYMVRLKNLMRVYSYSINIEI